MLHCNEHHRATVYLWAPVWALLLLGLASTARAQDAYRGTEADQQACIDDVNRLCSQHIPDERRIVGCLVANRRNLSPACRAVFSRGNQRR
jgi:hypothetical protein